MNDSRATQSLCITGSMSIFAWDKPLNLLKSYTSLLACFIKNQRLSQNVPNAAVADRFSCLSNVLSCAESTLRNGLLLQHQLIVRLLVALVTLGSFHLGAPDNLSTGKVHFEGCLARGCDEGWGKTKATWFQGPHLSSFCWTCLYHKAKPKLQAVQQEGLCKCRKFGWLWFWLYIFAKWNIHQTDTGRDEKAQNAKREVSLLRLLSFAHRHVCHISADLSIDYWDGAVIAILDELEKDLPDSHGDFKQWTLLIPSTAIKSINCPYLSYFVSWEMLPRFCHDHKLYEEILMTTVCWNYLTSWMTYSM